MVRETRFCLASGGSSMKTRKNYTPQEKVAIIRAHLIDKVPASQICTQFQLQRAILCKWLKQLFDDGAEALKRRPTIGKQPEAIQHRATDLNRQATPFESSSLDKRGLRSSRMSSSTSMNL